MKARQLVHLEEFQVDQRSQCCEYRAEVKEKRKQARKEEEEKRKEEERRRDEEATKAELAALAEKTRRETKKQEELENAKLSAQKKAKALMEKVLHFVAIDGCSTMFVLIHLPPSFITSGGRITTCTRGRIDCGTEAKDRGN